MRIRRQQSSLTFRKRRRRAGCLPLMVLCGLLVFTALLLGNYNAWRNLPVLQQPLDIKPALLAFAGGDLDTAIDLAEKIQEAQPDNPAALTLLVRGLVFRSYSDYNRSVDRTVALELTTEAMKRASSNLDILAIHAFALQANDLSTEASRLAVRVIERSPLNMPARLTLALAYGNQGIFEAGMREARRAVEIADSTAPDWRMEAKRVLAIAYSDLGQYDDAVKSVKEAIALNKGMIALYFERALYALQIGDSDAATSAYFHVIAFDPDNVKARLRLCELSSTMRERTAAVKYCHEVTQRAPEWSDGWYQLGREYFLQGDFASAQDALHRCSTLQVMQSTPVQERRFECWYIQGQAAEILGDCPALLATYNEYRTMTAGKDVSQTWVYPPEGPPGCASVVGAES